MGELKLGFCPFCGTDNYERNSTKLEENFFTAKCYCLDCDKEFTEYFGLDEVKFTEDGETQWYNNTLEQEEKDMLREWTEERMDFGVSFSELRKLERIKKVMEGGLNKDGN